MPRARTTLDLFGNDARPQGFRYQPDFLSHEEEQSLLRHIVPLPFREFEFQGFTGKRRIVSYGWRYDFNGGHLSRTEDMPDFLSVIRARAEHFAGIAPGTLHQVLITEYTPGAAIGWHKDRSVFGDSSGSRPCRSARSACASKPSPLGAMQSYGRATLYLFVAWTLADRVGAQHSRCGRPPLLAHLPQCPRRNSTGMSRTSALPKHLQPMLATLTDAPFDDKGWVFEDKYDGFRMVAKCQGGKVTLYSPQSRPCTELWLAM